MRIMLCAIFEQTSRDSAGHFRERSRRAAVPATTILECGHRKPGGASGMPHLGHRAIRTGEAPAIRSRCYQTARRQARS